MTAPHLLDTQPDYAIRIRGLTKHFGSQLIFENLNLDVRAGEILAIAGGSGTGKSVLLRTILGLLPFEAGSVEILGRDFASLSKTERVKVERQVGVLFQDGALFSSLTVLQNVQVPMREHMKLPQKTMDALALLKIAMVGLPPNAAYKYPSELSGGMRKRAGLARALALDPRIVFLDEPTSGLDPIGAAAFDRLIQSLQRTLGLTVYMITHDLDSIFAVCDRVAVLADKHVVREGAPMDLVRDPGHPWVRDYFCGERGRQIAKAS
ncbi:ABC transporter ATP-binding protein [Rhodomicrobium lacus]|uniref:ABC transporter ATP-binding protein n=1 Tax=Rhodomicrobium lacus TaxID=2498452 RepID=UPI000F8EF553|nr:ABC transporter ATP-binding protein [Rhodomicrobium lacus]WKW50814.1 ABC transporter ATP-binding protein [Rhodomicrobium lacus]